jgi:PIN domain nuclease of toxin-antitoxin system
MLDTHVLVWWVNGDVDQISDDAIAAITDASQGGKIVLSSITAWEIAMLVSRGRLSLSVDVTTWLEVLQKSETIRFVPIDNEIGVKAVELPGKFHKDPADRLIVATARKLGISIITADEKIRAYPHIRTIW